METSNRDAKKYLTPVLLLETVVANPNGVAVISSATGFSIAASKKDNVSYILTNDHFCADTLNARAQPLTSAVITYNQGDEKVPINHNPTGISEIVATSPEKDLCILKANEYIKPVVFEQSYPIEPLIPVKIIGAPQGVFPIVYDTYLAGMITRDSLPFYYMMESGGDYLFVSGPTVGGSSGSPIFNEEGRVIGIIFATTQTLYGGIGIHVDDILDYLDELDIDYRAR